MNTKEENPEIFSFMQTIMHRDASMNKKVDELKVFLGIENTSELIRFCITRIWRENYEKYIEMFKKHGDLDG